MRKYRIILFITALLITSLLFAACVPSEYTKGLKLSTDYPIDDFPIMEDSVVFYCDNDEDSFTIKYGTDEDISIVADFYKTLFIENQITPSDENETNSTYTAEGLYKDYLFSIKAYIAADKNEKRVYTSVVKIKIKSRSQIIETQQKFIGFWRQESYENSSGNKRTTYDDGTAYEFYADGSFNFYSNYGFHSSGSWAMSSESSVLVTAPTGHSGKVTISFEKRNEKNYLLLESSKGKFIFFKDFSNGFTKKEDSSTGNTTIPTSQLTDKQLSSTIADITWYFIKYVDKDGENHNNLYSEWILYKSDGTFEEYTSFDYVLGKWYISEGRLYCDYSDGSSLSIVIDIETADGAKNLYHYSNSYSGSYWHYSDVPTDSYNSSLGPITYTSDDVVTNALSGRVFKDYFYNNANGSQEEMRENIMTFNADGTMENYYYGQTVTGSWKFIDGYLELELDNGESYKYEAYVEYEINAGNYYLILVDQEESDDCCWVFKTRKQ